MPGLAHACIASEIEWRLPACGAAFLSNACVACVAALLERSLGEDMLMRVVVQGSSPETTASALRVYPAK